MALPDRCQLCDAGRENQYVVTPHVYGAAGMDRAYFHCRSCDVRYLYPGLTAEEEDRFYAAEFEGYMASRAGVQGGWASADKHIRANETTRARRMKYLSPHLAGRSAILEIGCSSGFMLLPLREAGHNCFGVEPSGVFRESLLDRGLTVYASVDELGQRQPDLKFDLILHFFVLEHITQLHSFLETQITMLKPGGKLIFEIPNVADPLYSIYDIPAFERFYWSVAHPWYFSEESLNYVLGQFKLPYEILRDQRYDLSNHMIWARDGRPGGMGRFTDKLGAEIEEQYKQELIRIGRCDTLVGIISKG
jgi:SAM-dependent methyltransferase